MKSEYNFGLESSVVEKSSPEVSISMPESKLENYLMMHPELEPHVFKSASVPDGRVYIFGADIVTELYNCYSNSDRNLLVGNRSISDYVATSVDALLN